MRCHFTNNSNVRALILTLYFCLYRNFFPIYKLLPQLLSLKKVCQQTDTIVSKKMKRNFQHCYIWPKLILYLVNTQTLILDNTGWYIYYTKIRCMIYLHSTLHIPFSTSFNITFIHILFPFWWYITAMNLVKKKN